MANLPSSPAVSQQIAKGALSSLSFKERMALMDNTSITPIINIMKSGVGLLDASRLAGMSYGQVYARLKKLYGVKFSAFVIECDQARKKAKRDACISLFWEHRTRGGSFNVERICEDTRLLAKFEDCEKLNAHAKWAAKHIVVSQV